MDHRPRSRVQDTMRVKNKEYEITHHLGELYELCSDYPNDKHLGEQIRKITRRALVNNPKGLRATTGISDISLEELERWSIE